MQLLHISSHTQDARLSGLFGSRRRQIRPTKKSAALALADHEERIGALHRLRILVQELALAIGLDELVDAIVHDRVRARRLANTEESERLPNDIGHISSRSILLQAIEHLIERVEDGIVLGRTLHSVVADRILGSGDGGIHVQAAIGSRNDLDFESAHDCFLRQLFGCEQVRWRDCHCLACSLLMPL